MQQEAHSVETLLPLFVLRRAVASHSMQLLH